MSPAKSKSQQKFMGMVHAAQKGGGAASPEVAAVAKSMAPSDVTDFASIPQKGLPTRAPAPPMMNVGGPGPGRPSPKTKVVGKPVQKMPMPMAKGGKVKKGGC